MKNYIRALAAACFTVCTATTVLAQDNNTQSIPQPQSTDTTKLLEAAYPADDFKDKVGNTMFFDYNTAELKPKSLEMLAKAVAWLKANPTATLTIEGHTDERGSNAYNMALGERRAVAVKDYLIAQGITNDRVKTVSFGEDRPASIGTEELNFLFNRRAVMILN